MNLNDMFQAAAKAEDTGFSGDLLGPEELKNGDQILCQVAYSKEGEKDGVPRWTIKLKVLEGEHEGGEFFDSIYLSGKNTDGAKSFNKRQFAKLQATGLGADFFSSNPSTEAIAKAVKDKKILVSIAWQKPGDDGRQFSEHKWAPAAAAAAVGGFVPEGF